jgi:nucleoside-diphosphate-sugar epimerase
MRLLVTGGSGFIGTNLVRTCRSRGIDVCNVDVRAPRWAAQRDAWWEGDVTDSVLLGHRLRDFGATHLVHLAAVTDQSGDSMADYAVNVEGVRSVLSAVESAPGLQRAVFVSTRLVTPLGVVPESPFDYCPPNFYGRTKAIGEQLVRAHRGPIEWVLVRPTSIWGPWGEEPYRAFFLSLANGTYVHPGGERILKHYGYVGNTVHQLLRILVAPADRVHGRTLYLADPEPIEVGAFAALIRARMGLPPPRTVPVWALRALGAAGDLAQRARVLTAPPLTTERLRHLRTPMLYPMDELVEIVGDPAYTLVEGIDATLAHLRDTGALSLRAAAGRRSSAPQPPSPDSERVPQPRPLRERRRRREMVRPIGDEVDAGEA